MAKIQLDDYVNGQFADMTATNGGVFNPPGERSMAGLISVASPAYLSPRKVEGFSSAKDAINRNVAYNRAFAKIDFPQFKPRDEEDWSVLRAIGAVAGTMSDYAFQRLEERKNQEDMIFVTEATAKYQQAATKLWSEKYEKRLSGYATQNDELHKEFQAELGQTWNEVLNSAPAREGARLAAARRRVELDNSIMTRAAESAINFETKYAVKAADEGLQALVREAQQADEFGVGEKRGEVISRINGQIEAFRFSNRGNAILAEELKSKTFKELGKGILAEDSKRDPTRFLALWKRGDYNKQVSTGLPGPNGEPGAKIDLLTDEIHTWGVSHAASIETQLQQRAAAAASMAATARMSAMTTAQSNLDASMRVIANPNETEDDRRLAFQTAIQASSVLAKHNPGNVQVAKQADAIKTAFEVTEEYGKFQRGELPLTALMGSVVEKDAKGNSTYVYTDKRGNEHRATVKTNLAPAIMKLAEKDLADFAKDPSSLDSTLLPALNRYLVENKIDPASPEAANKRAEMRRELAVARYGEENVNAMHGGGKALFSSAELKARVDAVGRAPDPMGMFNAAKSVASPAVLYKASAEAPLATKLAFIVSQSQGAELAAEPVVAALMSDKSARDKLSTADKEAADAVANKVLLNSPFYLARHEAVTSTRGSTEAIARRDDAISIFREAARAMKGQGVGDEVIERRLSVLAETLGKDVTATGRVVAVADPVIRETGASPREYERAALDLAVSGLDIRIDKVREYKQAGDMAGMLNLARESGLAMSGDGESVDTIAAKLLSIYGSFKRDSKVFYSDGKYRMVTPSGAMHDTGISRSNLSAYILSKRYSE